MGWRQSLCLGGLETRLATGGCPPVPTSDNWVYRRPGTSPFRCKLHLISACMSAGNRAIIHSPGFRIMTTPGRGSSNSNNRLLANARNAWGPPPTYPLQFLSLEKAALLIHFDLTTPGYKCSVMKEKKNKGTNVGKFGKSPLKSITWRIIHLHTGPQPRPVISSALGKGTHWEREEGNTIRTGRNRSKVTKTLILSVSV